MRKLIVGIVCVLIAAGVPAFAQIRAADGLYFAEDDAYASSGWKEMVVVAVKSGKITSVNWNGVSNLGVVDKKSYAAAGKYGMARAAKQGEWDVQAAKVEAYLMSTQNPNFTRYTNAEGNTDAITGVSIHVKGFFLLVDKALKAGPVPKGMYKKDGWYYAEAASFDPKTGWKDNVLLTVVNGTIVDVVYNGLSKDARKKSKLVEARKAATAWARSRSRASGIYRLNGSLQPC
ncbi:MAG: hypothetical protein HC888_16845 [Candidatus Competibacteraceae bacterium]|nr:hypothetical protein [Candidatus Competibacteraceae bacterium]